MRLRRQIIVAIACVQLSFATTVVMVITPKGMIVGSDSGYSEHTGDFVTLNTGNVSKFVTVQDRFVVASIGTADISRPNPPFATISFYNFLTWIKKVEEAMPANVSVEDLAKGIQEKSAATFIGFDEVLASKWFKQPKPLERFRPFIQYVIVGYAKEGPQIYVVQLYIDWDERKLIGPKTILLYPDSNAAGGNYFVYGIGISQVLEDISNPRSYAYKQVSAECPSFRTLMARHDITVAEAEPIVRAMIAVEEDTNPTEVFGDISTVTILPNSGVGKIVIKPWHSNLTHKPTAGLNSRKEPVRQ